MEIAKIKINNYFYYIIINIIWGPKLGPISLSGSSFHT